MNLPTIPSPPQYQSMYDGSKAINQSEQVNFNTQVSTAIQANNNNMLKLQAQLAEMRRDLQELHATYDDFYRFVEHIHPEVLKEYITSLAVQARMEQTNDGTNV
jgi:hypothetical protein